MDEATKAKIHDIAAIINEAYVGGMLDAGMTVEQVQIVMNYIARRMDAAIEQEESK